MGGGGKASGVGWGGGSNPNCLLDGSFADFKH